MITAVLDACVLYQGTVTDFLLNAAEAGAFDPIWSDTISTEWVRNLARRATIPVDRINYRRSQMDFAFPAARCDADPDILDRVIDLCRNKHEAKDAHVLATAVTAEAAVIVTHNVSDFPTHLTSPFGIRIIAPDPFICELAAAYPSSILEAARAHHNSLRRPSLSAAQYLELLSSPKAELHRTRIWLEANRFS